jgi:hypothetical protein
MESSSHNCGCSLRFGILLDQVGFLKTALNGVCVAPGKICFFTVLAGNCKFVVSRILYMTIIFPVIPLPFVCYCSLALFTLVSRVPHTHTHMHTCVHTQRIHMHTRVHSLTHTHTHTHAHACAHTLTLTLAHMRAHAHTYTFTRACTHTHTLSLSHTHTHTHTHTALITFISTDHLISLDTPHPNFFKTCLSCVFRMLLIVVRSFLTYLILV